MTPGVTPETVDGMSLAKIEAIIEALRSERYRWTAGAAHLHRQKELVEEAPAGHADLVGQAAARGGPSLLEAYYEPQFSDRSHGFRPGRGLPHRAEREIQRQWSGTTWFIEGDISDCFESLDHVC